MADTERIDALEEQEPTLDGFTQLGARTGAVALHSSNHPTARASAFAWRE